MPCARPQFILVLQLIRQPFALRTPAYTFVSLCYCSIVSSRQRGRCHTHDHTVSLYVSLVRKNILSRICPHMCVPQSCLPLPHSICKCRSWGVSAAQQRAAVRLSLVLSPKIMACIALNIFCSTVWLCIRHVVADSWGLLKQGRWRKFI